MFMKILSISSMLINFLGAAEVKEPKAKKVPKILKMHEDTRTDNYYWMGKKTDKAVIAHLKSENAYLAAKMKHTKDLQEKLYKEMRARIKEDDQSVPYKFKDYNYFTKMELNKEYPIYCRRNNSPDSKEEVVLDVNILGKGLDFIKVTKAEFHPDQNLMAYGVDKKGDRIFTVFFKDLKSGKILPNKIENITANFTWAESGKFLFYAKQDPKTLRSHKIFRYDFVKNTHELIFEEKDEKFDTYIYKTQARNYLFIANNSTLSSEIRFAKATDPLATFNLINPREPNLEYDVHDGGDRLFVRTNWNATNFKVMEVNLEKPTKENWKEVIAHRKDVFIDSLEIFKNHLVLTERQKGLTQVNVMNRLKLSDSAYINFPDAAYTVELAENAEYDTSTIRYNFVSMNRPNSVYDYDIAKKQSVLLKERIVPTYDSNQYVSERLYAPTHDGLSLPISLVYKNGLKKDKSAPLLVYGYGSYGISVDPFFSTTNVSLLDRGFVFAIIHIRGGSEMGRQWYDDGKFFKKKNSFQDFISGTEYLIAQGYADPKKVYANGGSAGGLLMGAVMNLRPELYHGIIADVPFVDVLTSMLDSSLPLTTGEYEEWGNPNNKDYYDYMKSYSPYDNVTEKDYPHLLVTTGLNDSQVPYWEPAKWVSKLRELRSNKTKLLLMKIEMEVGHGGKSGRFEYLRDEALSHAFLLELSGKNDNKQIN